MLFTDKNLDHVVKTVMTRCVFATEIAGVEDICTSKKRSTTKIMEINKNKKLIKTTDGSVKTFFTSNINIIKTKVSHYRLTTNFLLISIFIILICVISFDYGYLLDFITGVSRILKNLIKKSSSKLKPAYEYIPVTPEQVRDYAIVYFVAWVIIEYMLFELGGHDRENSEVDEDYDL